MNKSHSGCLAGHFSVYTKFYDVTGGGKVCIQM